MGVSFASRDGAVQIKAIKPNFPDDFEIYDPKITEKVFEGGNKRSIKTFEYLLIPRNKGNYKIPKLDFSYFDIKQKKYISGCDIGSVSENICGGSFIKFIIKRRYER